MSTLRVNDVRLATESIFARRASLAGDHHRRLYVHCGDVCAFCRSHVRHVCTCVQSACLWLEPHPIIHVYCLAEVGCVMVPLLGSVMHCRSTPRSHQPLTHTVCMHPLNAGRWHDMWFVCANDRGGRVGALRRVCCVCIAGTWTGCYHVSFSVSLSRGACDSVIVCG